MPTSRPSHPIALTTLLNQIDQPNAKVWNEILVSSWERLERIARRYHRASQGSLELDTVGLINEAWIRVYSRQLPHWNDRQHFYNTMAQMMRQVVSNHIRDRKAQKRIPREAQISLDKLTEEVEPVFSEDTLGYLDQLLDRLQQEDERAYNLVMYRFYLGLTISEASELLQISERTAYREWQFIQAWFKKNWEDEVL